MSYSRHIILLRFRRANIRTTYRYRPDTSERSEEGTPPRGQAPCPRRHVVRGQGDRRHWPRGFFEGEFATRSATRSSSVDDCPRRRCASTSRAQSEIPSERPPPRRAASRTQRNNPGSAKSASRTANTSFAVAGSGRLKATISKGRTKEKDGARALLEDHDTPMVIPMDESCDANETFVSGRRSAKRHRLSPPPSRSLGISRMALDN